MNRMVCISLLLVASVLGADLGAAQQRESSPRLPQSKFVSPTVVMTALTLPTREVTQVLDVLVLWRGSPGWFMPTSGSTTSSVASGSSEGNYFARAVFGGIDLRVDVKKTPWTILIQSKPVVLDPSDANVVFVDMVDSVSGPLVVGTMRADLTLPRGESRIESVLQRSAESLAYLQCDPSLKDARLRPALERCLQISKR